MALRYSLRQLEYFVAVGDCGSITLAAERVNVSSPSISAAIAQLEAEFGLTLFVRRHAQGLTLSQAGRQMIVAAREILARAEALNRLAGTISGAVQGPLAVGCLLTFAQLVLPHIRRGFELRHPQVQLRQAEMNQHEIFNALRDSQIDLALTYDLDIPPDLQFEPLASLPPHVLVSPNHALADRAAVSIADLADLPMILLDLPYSADYFLAFFKAAGTKPVIAERTRDMAVMRSLVANDFGYAIANVRPVDDRAPDGKALRFIPLTGPVRPMWLGVLTTTGAEAALTVRAFLDHCRTEISQDVVPGMRLGET